VPGATERGGVSITCAIVANRGGFQIDVDCESSARVIGITGVSGAGKTTLLHAAAGLIPVEQAQLIVDGTTVVDTGIGLASPPHLRGIGYVFQDARLFPHLNVADNIAYGVRFAANGRDPGPLIDLLGIGHLLQRWPRNLSGGEARRVATARALATGPRLLLLDEPFSGLDQARRAELIPYLVALTQEIEVAILVVSHQAADLDALGADQLVMDAGRISRVRRP